MLRYFFRVKLLINVVRCFFPGLLHHLLSELTTLPDWPTANSIKPSPVNGLWRSGQFKLGCVSQQSEPAATRLDLRGIGGQIARVLRGTSPRRLGTDWRGKAAWTARVGGVYREILPREQIRLTERLNCAMKNGISSSHNSCPPADLEKSPLFPRSRH